MCCRHYAAVYTSLAVNNGSLAFFSTQQHNTTKQNKKRYMSEKRTWDESRSPQWRYLLSKDSMEKRQEEKREERMEQAEGELKKGISKRKRRAQEKQKEKRSLARTTTKKGKEILYSASPGGERNRYVNTEFEKSRNNNNIPITFEK